MRVVIVGNSNSGKTTLFNALTGSDEKTGNWHGVTVDKAQKSLKSDSNIEIVDLSGLESLSTYSIEEERSKEFLEKGEYDLILNVIELSNIKNALKLTKELTVFNKPVLVFFNFYNEFLNNGGKVDIHLLKKSVSKHIILGDAINGECVDNIIKAIKNGEYSKIKVDDNLAQKALEIKELKLTKIDKLLLNPKTSIIIYLSIVFATFYLAFGRFGFGSIIGYGIDFLIGATSSLVSSLCKKCLVNPFLTGLVTESITAVGSVLIFIPQIVVLQLLLIVLEESGIIARISFVTDNLLSKIGLNGKAVFLILMGFGCTALSVKLTSGLENKGIKAKTAKSLPFIICSAKVPVILFFASAIFKKYTYLVLFVCYLISIIFCFLYLWIDKKIRNKKSAPLLLLVPPLRKINFKICLKPLKKSVKEFIIKLGTIVTLVSVAIFLLKSVSTDFELLSSDQIDKSILAFLGKNFKFIFMPIGVDSWEISTAVISGIFAKESIISTFKLLTDGNIFITFSQSIAILLFILFYTPCVCALESFRIEFGVKFALKTAVFQFLIALGCCYFIYFFLEILWFRIIIISIVFSLIIIKVLYENFYCRKRRKIIKNATKRI